MHDARLRPRSSISSNGFVSSNRLRFEEMDDKEKDEYRARKAAQARKAHKEGERRG